MTESSGIATFATVPSAHAASSVAGGAPGADPGGEAARGSSPGLALPVSASGPTSRVDRDLLNLGNDGIQPASLVVSLLFTAFTVYNWVAFAPGIRGISCAYDLVLVALALAIYRKCRRVELSLRGVQIATATLSFGILGNIVLTALLGVNQLFTFDVAILMIASVGIALVPVWAIAIAMVELGGWGAVAALRLSGGELLIHSLAMMSSLAVATIVHTGRYRARMRILELRAGDARREEALQRALAEADDARRSLDRKVEERTRALRNELDERERLEEQLRHAQKLEAVGRLAGGIAHDFNNLLTVIRMSLATVSEPDAPQSDRDEAMRDASDATDRAAALTHDLLAFARKQTLQRTAVAVTEILSGVQRMIRRVAEASIRVEVVTAADPGEILADRHQIEQVLLNLAINACDAMGNRGTLTLTVDSVDLSGAEATTHRVRPGAYVRIAVTDTGTGMDEATRLSVFEPFFTTKAVGRGTGLGLAVAHGIVTQHGGQIEVESELGKGSTFTVFLPRSRGTSPVAIIKPARPATARDHETVLVVEDEAPVRRSVARNLERLGYHVLVAHDAEDALRIADGLDHLDLLLTDVVMPGIDGPELASRMRARWRELPVLFVTGYSADRLARSGAVSPRDKVLVKPYQLTELARILQTMLNGAEARGAE